MHPTQGVEIFGSVSTSFGIAWPSSDIRGKFYGDRPRGTPPGGGGGLNTREIAKYSDFGPMELRLYRPISETVQDRR